LDQTVSFAGGEVERGDGMRYYFDLSSTRPATEMAELREVDRGGIRRVGWEPLPDGGVRAFVDTRGDLLAQTFVMTDPYRLVVDLEARPTSAASEIGEQRAPVDLIVLDPGHGGLDYGARYEGMKESLLALDITERVADQLRSRLPHARVAMTRTRDVMVSLEERIAFANSVQADLFVSIHLNAADEPVMNGGVATFVLDTENDQQAVRLAARENGSSTESVTGLQRILAGLHRDEQVASSRLAASFLQREIVIAGRRVIPRLPDRGVKSALFYVLVGARMPAVLVEASFLTQPEEARQLRTARYRQVLAEGIATGIVSYARR
jgi:N-acetylmuramoyl-L-alanine amidase